MVKNQSSKQERFKRLATKRTNDILNRLRVLGNCANRNVYDYTEDDIQRIFSEVERKTKEVKSKFYFPENKEFRL